jgi:hypothetical protein
VLSPDTTYIAYLKIVGVVVFFPMPFRYLSSPTALALLNYSLPCIYLWIVYVILFPLYIHLLCCLSISLLRKPFSKDVLVLVLKVLEFMCPMCSCPTFFYALLSPLPTHVCPSRVLLRVRYTLMHLICMLPPHVDSYLSHRSLLGPFLT